MSLDFSQQVLCAQLVLPLLTSPTAADLLLRTGVDVAALRVACEAVLASVDVDPLELVLSDITPDSEYESTQRRKKSKETERDIAAILRCYSKQTLTGQQVKEALEQTPKQALVEFVVTDVMGWSPPQRRTSNTTAGRMLAASA